METDVSSVLMVTMVMQGEELLTIAAHVLAHLQIHPISEYINGHMVSASITNATFYDYDIL